jgi:hypothetical protein
MEKDVSAGDPNTSPKTFAPPTHVELIHYVLDGTLDPTRLREIAILAASDEDIADVFPPEEHFQ